LIRARTHIAGLVAKTTDTSSGSQCSPCDSHLPFIVWKARASCLTFLDNGSYFANARNSQQKTFSVSIGESKKGHVTITIQDDYLVEVEDASDKQFLLFFVRSLARSFVRSFVRSYRPNSNHDFHKLMKQCSEFQTGSSCDTSGSRARYNMQEFKHVFCRSSRPHISSKISLTTLKRTRAPLTYYVLLPRIVVESGTTSNLVSCSTSWSSIVGEHYQMWIVPSPSRT